MGVTHDSAPRGFLADRLRTARLAAKGGAGMSQQELAAKTGVSQATISDYERGRRQPSLTVLVAMAGELQVSAGWLLDDEAPEQEQQAERTSLLSQQLGQILGLSQLTYLGPAGLLTSDCRVRHSDRQTSPPSALAANTASQAAETGVVYRIARGSLPSPVLVDRSLAGFASWLFTYTGPDVGRLCYGDLLMVTKSPEQARPPAGYLQYAASDGTHSRMTLCAVALTNTPAPTAYAVGLTTPPADSRVQVIGRVTGIINTA